jgi:hypothetical protein
VTHALSAPSRASGHPSSPVAMSTGDHIRRTPPHLLNAFRSAALTSPRAVSESSLGTHAQECLLHVSGYPPSYWVSGEIMFCRLCAPYRGYGIHLAHSQIYGAEVSPRSLTTRCITSTARRALPRIIRAPRLYVSRRKAQHPARHTSREISQASPHEATRFHLRALGQSSGTTPSKRSASQSSVIRAAPFTNIA